MKKTAYVCVPWLDTVYRIGAIMLFAGTFFTLVANAKGLAVQYWHGNSISVLSDLMVYIFMLAAAAMLYFSKKYLPRMAAFVLLIGSIKYFDDFLLAWIIPLIFLLAAIGGRWNRPIRPLMRWHIPTPWLCLLGALCVAGEFFVTLSRLDVAMHVVSEMCENAGKDENILWPALISNSVPELVLTLVILAGLFLLLFFTQPVPRSAITDVTISRTVNARNNPCFVAAGFVLLADLIITLLTAEALNAHGFFGYVRAILPYVLYLVIFALIFAKKRSNLLWLIVCLLFMTFESKLDTVFGVFTVVAFPLPLYLLLLISAIGFVGNDPIYEREGLKITPADIAALLILALMLLADVRTLVLGIKRLLETQPHKVTEAYKSHAWPEVLRYFSAVLRSAALTLLVLFSRLERCETTIIAKTLAFLARIKNIRRNFQNNVGRKICRLAYVCSSIFVVLMLISLAGAIVCLAINILCLFSTAFNAWLPFTVTWALALYFLAAAAGLFIEAMTTWFIYAYGQASDDLHKVTHRLGFGLALPRVDGKHNDDDLPDF